MTAFDSFIGGSDSADPDLATTGRPDEIAAATGVLSVNSPIPDPLDELSTALLTMRENTELSTTGENWQRARCCGLQPVRGWVDGCSPVYDIDQHSHKCTATCWGRVSFWPFTFYAAEEVNCLGGPIDVEEEARRQVNRNTDFAVTTELDHAPWSGNPSLRSEALDLTPVNPGTNAYEPVQAKQALAILHAAYRLRSAGGFVIAAAIEVLPYLIADSLVVNRAGQWRTTTGVPIITGAGFSGVAPIHDFEGQPKPTAVDSGNVDRAGDPILVADPGMLAAPLQGTSTIYALRSVPEYLVGRTTTYGEIFQQGSGVEQHQRTNSELSEAVRLAALRFDPFCIYSIQLNLKAGECA